MAVQGTNQRNHFGSLPWAFGLTAVIAAALSLAAALAGLLSQGGPAPVITPTAAEEAAARENRIAFFEGRVAADPIDYLSLNTLAGEYLQRARETGDVSDYQRAELAASRSVDVVSRDNYTGIYYLTSSKLVAHDYVAARDLSLRAIDLKPASAPAYGTLSDAYIGLGQYGEAATALNRMVKLEPSFTALTRLANLAYIQGDRVDMVDFWKQALNTKSRIPIENVAWAHVQLGNTYLAIGDIAKAEAEQRKALQLNSEYVHALAGMGAVKAAQQRWDEAIALHTAAIERLPQPKYVSALGDIYARAGRSADAANQYALVEVIDQLYVANGINTDLQLALFYADHDINLDRALTLAMSTYAESPNVFAADTLAWALYKNNRLDEAAARSAEALQLGTPDASMHYHAAVIAQARGQRDEARQHLEAVMSLNPRFSVLHADDARQRLADLKGGR